MEENNTTNNSNNNNNIENPSPEEKNTLPTLNEIITDKENINNNDNL
jgi:hypothetical protein